MTRTHATPQSAEREEYLDTLVSRVDETAKHQVAYLTTNEDAAEPLYYSDWEVDTSRLDDETAPLVEKLRAREGKGWKSVLKDLCNLEMTDIYISDNEICSYVLGECEEQITDELHDALMALTDDEHEYVRNGVRECYLPERRNKGSTEIYLNLNYDRWVLIVDLERLTEHVAAYGSDT